MQTQTPQKIELESSAVDYVMVPANDRLVVVFNSSNTEYEYQVNTRTSSEIVEMLQNAESVGRLLAQLRREEVLTQVEA